MLEWVKGVVLVLSLLEVMSFLREFWGVYYCSSEVLQVSRARLVPGRLLSYVLL